MTVRRLCYGTAGLGFCALWAQQHLTLPGVCDYDAPISTKAELIDSLPLLPVSFAYAVTFIASPILQAPGYAIASFRRSVKRIFKPRPQE